LLDLARVGSGAGVNTEFLKEAIAVLDGDIYLGGGISDIDDLLALRTMGVSGVLLATALHSGKIGFADLKKAGLL
jgi:phosphoribosylformimino-5-aminoimidazole carboxamide ribotide isomerase